MEKLCMIQGTYQVIREIGSGSGGTVYLAYHTRLQKNVVLKKMKSGAKKLLNNRTETDILKNLHHLYLPQVFDFVVDVDESGNEVVYTVMDFIQGKSFDDLLKEGQTFTPTQVAKYMTQLCEAVDYLHSQVIPIIHGDIKPANVMLTPDDNICLIDFNISGFSDSLEILGFTRGYAAPEQCMAARANRQRKKSGEFETREQTIYDDKTVLDEAQADDTVIDDVDGQQIENEVVYKENSGFDQVVMIDCRADIFSIGATMYPLLTGRKPDADYEKQVPVGDLDIPVSEGLAYVVDKSMELKPENRFQSAKDMLRALNALGKKDRRYKRLVRVQIAVIALCIIFTAVCVVISYIGFRQMRIEKAEGYYAVALEMFEEKAYDDDLAYILEVALRDESLYDKGQLGNLYYLAAECSFKSEQYEAAADFFRTSLIYNRTSQEAYCNYAISLARVGKWQEALAVIDEAMECGVNADQIYLMKGELSKAQGDIETAIENFVSCIAETKDDYAMARAYICYSELYTSMDGYAETEEYILADIEVLKAAKQTVADEYLPIILQRLANAYCSMGDLAADDVFYMQAIDTLNESVSMGWETFDIDMNLALLYENVGMYDESDFVLKKLLEQYGDHYAVYKRLAFLELDIQSENDSNQRDYGIFLQYYEKAVELFQTAGNQSDSDVEMKLLENAYKTLETGGWLNGRRN